MTTIPQHHIDFCKAVAALAAQHGLNSVSLTLRPGFKDEWRDQINMGWEQGRHGEDAKDLIVTSTVTVRAEIMTQEQS